LSVCIDPHIPGGIPCFEGLDLTNFSFNSVRVSVGLLRINDREKKRRKVHILMNIVIELLSSWFPFRASSKVQHSSLCSECLFSSVISKILICLTL
jgi:hypothetical protein